MQSVYEQWNSNIHQQQGVVNNSSQSMSNVLPTDYLNFIASNFCSNQQDLLNSSLNDKKWVNGRDWLNSSLNLPPELR